MKRKLLLISSLLILSSCNGVDKVEDSNSSLDSPSSEDLPSFEGSSNSSGEVVETFDDYLANMISKTPSVSFENYQKALAICDELYSDYDTKTYKIIKNGGVNKTWPETSSNLYNDYWTSHAKLVKALKQALQDDEKYAYYADKIENCDFYKNLDESNIYVDRDYVQIDLQELETLGKEIEANIENKDLSKEDLAKKMEKYDELFGNLINNKQLASVQSDIFADNEELQDKSADFESKYDNTLNTYKSIFKKSLLDDTYKDYIYSYFELTEEDYDYFVNVEIYDDETMALLNRETDLVSSFEKAYNMEDSSFDYAQNYIDLVTVRNEIAKAFNYDNYYEYAFVETYDRDYTVEESKNLATNILGSQGLIDANDALYSSVSATYASLLTSYLKESKIMSSLEYCAEIEPRAKQALLELKTYGNFNLEYRNNKYGGSYVAQIDANSNRFILINRTGDITDYSTVHHEFGHYVALTQYDPDLEGDSYSLDLCEVHSQGMEYLMKNYYGALIDNKKLAKALENYGLYEAIWTLQSGSAIAEFERYAYTTTDTLTASSLMKKSDELLGGIGTTAKYYDIPHIFSSPAYYISYVTSIIAALELYSMDFETAKKSYQTIVSYGPYNKFKFVLEKANLLDPFSDEAWELVLNKIKASAGIK